MPFLKRITRNLTHTHTHNCFRKMIQKQLTPMSERSTNKSMNTEDKTPVNYNSYYEHTFLTKREQDILGMPKEIMGSKYTIVCQDIPLRLLCI